MATKSILGPNLPGSYHYDPLPQPDSIRQIELHPSEDKESPIRCSLILATLRDVEEDILNDYTALSYVWGDATDVMSHIHSPTLTICILSLPRRFYPPLSFKAPPTELLIGRAD
jgi:hypothetical protein